MSSPLRSLLIGFSAEVQGQEKLDKVDLSLESIFDKVKMVGSAFAGLSIVKGLSDFFGGSIEAGRNLDITAEKLGLTVDELERYRYAANQAGIETTNADRAILLMNRTIGEAETGGKSANKELANFAGGLRDAQGHMLPLSDVLSRVADKFKGIKDPADKTQLAMRLFGRSGATLIPLLDKGSEGIRKYSAEFDELGGGLGGKFAKEAKEAGDEVRKLSLTFDVLKARLTGSVLPWITKLVDTGISAVGMFRELEKHTLFAQTALISLGAIAAVALAPFAIEILPIVAALGAMYLLFDDLYTLFNGGDSLTGRLLDDLFGPGGAKQFVTDCKAAFQGVKDAVNDALPTLKEIGSVFREVSHSDLFAATLKSMPDVIKWLGRILKANFQIRDGDLVGAFQTITGNTDDEINEDIDPAFKDTDDNNPTLRMAKMWANRRKFGWHAPQADPATLPPPRGSFNLEQDANAVTLAPIDLGTAAATPGITIKEVNITTTVQGAHTNDETGAVVADSVHNSLQDAMRKAVQALPAAKPASRK